MCSRPDAEWTNSAVCTVHIDTVDMGNLDYHMRMKHGDVQSVKNVRGAGKVTESKKFKCQHCGSMFTRRSSLD